MGRVEIKGKVDVFQYWPHGNSDVDTVTFVPDFATALYHGDSASVPVRTFFETGGSMIDDDDQPGATRFKAILRPGGKLSIRLQGIDAPELHYASNFRGDTRNDAASLLAKQIARHRSHRQPYGKLTTDQFATRIRTLLGIPAPAGPNPSAPVDATVAIAADGIGGSVDVFGRVVGAVSLSNQGQTVVLNDFALTEGFAFSSFYGSMTISEIDRMAALYKAHGTNGAPKSRLRDNVSSHLKDFEPDLWTTRSGRDNDRDSNGSVFPARCFDPKMFRRCVDWVGFKTAFGDTITLLDYMRSNAERVVKLDDYRAAGGDWSAAPSVALGALIGADGKLLYKPGDVVFESRQANVVNKHGVALPQRFTDPIA